MVADEDWLIALTPPEDYDFAAPSDQDEEGRIDLLLSADGLFVAADTEDELSWLEDLAFAGDQ